MNSHRCCTQGITVYFGERVSVHVIDEIMDVERSVSVLSGVKPVGYWRAVSVNTHQQENHGQCSLVARRI